MPVLIRDTPLGYQWYEEGFVEGWLEGSPGSDPLSGPREGERRAVQRLAELNLRRRFDGHPDRIEAIAKRLAGRNAEERAARIGRATCLEDLES